MDGIGIGKSLERMSGASINSLGHYVDNRLGTVVGVHLCSRFGGIELLVRAGRVVDVDRQRFARVEGRKQGNEVELGQNKPSKSRTALSVRQGAISLANGSSETY